MSDPTDTAPCPCRKCYRQRMAHMGVPGRVVERVRAWLREEYDSIPQRSIQ